MITGVTGQDGAYLAELLLSKGYEVHGLKRRSSLFNTDRIDHLYQDPHVDNRNFVLHYGDLTDSTSLIRVIQAIQPDEIYNLAAQSHVAVSFESPEYTANADAIGTLRILEAIRILGLEKKSRFYQASTSELFGEVQETPQRRPRRSIRARRMPAPSCMRTGSRSTTAKPMASMPVTASCSTMSRRCAARPSSPARSRGTGTHQTGSAGQGLPRQHERQARLGPCQGLCRDAVADAAAGPARGLRDRHRQAVFGAEFVEIAAAHVDMDRVARRGLDEQGNRCRDSGKVIVAVDPRYFRPTEVETLLGDAARRAKTGLDAEDHLRGDGAGDDADRPGAGKTR